MGDTVRTQTTNRITPFNQATMQWPTVSVVIPTLNEAKNLPHILPHIPTWIHEVIIVDGRSSDNTIEVARQLMPNVKIVLETRKGKGAALRRGFSEATGEIIAMLDADGSMLPREIHAYVGSLIAGADFAKGSRFLQGGGTDDMSLLRFSGNFGLTKLVNTLFRSQYSDLCYGYCAFWRRVLPRLNLQSDGFEIETEMNIRAIRAGLKIVEIPSFEFDRIHGTSNLNTWRDGWRVLKKIVSEFKEHHFGSRELSQTPAAHISSANDPLQQAILTLAKEARYLNVMQKNMPRESYEAAVDAIKEACWLLLQSDPKHIELVTHLPQKHSDLDIQNLFAKRDLMKHVG